MTGINNVQRTELQKGYCNGPTYSFRQRCLMILMKCEKRTSLEIAGIFGSCAITVDYWLARYQSAGIAGLQGRPGTEYQSIIQAAELESVKAAVKRSRQRMAAARAKLEMSQDKKFSKSSLKRNLSTGFY